MTTEQDRILEALKTAIDIETEGKECYTQASLESQNEVGRELLQALALQEEDHLRRFIEIYGAVQKNKGWPTTHYRGSGGEKLKELFSGACKKVGIQVKAINSEFDVINSAIDKEKKSQDFYNRQSKSATYESERDFYHALADEEREHELILIDYYEYLKSPVDWFTRMERHSLDGG